MIKSLIKEGGLLAVSQVVSKATGILLFLVYAAFLTPLEYGQAAWCWAIVSVAESLYDFGLSQSYIHRNSRDASVFGSLIWGTILATAVWCLYLVGASYLFHAVSSDDLVAALLLSCNILLAARAISNPISAYLCVEKRFNLIAQAEIISNIVSSSIAIAMAWKGYGAWAVIIKALINSVMIAGYLVCSVKKFPINSVNKSTIKELFRFGFGVTLSKNVAPMIEHLGERLLVGISFGTSGLGLVEFSKKPVNLIAQAIDMVLRSFGFSRLVSSRRESSTEGQSAYRALLLLSAGGGLVSFVVIVTFALLIVPYLGREEWAGASGLMTIYAWGIVALAIRSIAVYQLMAKGLIKKLLRLSVLSTLLTLFAIMLGSLYGTLEMIATMFSVALTLTATLYYYQSVKTKEVSDGSPNN